MFGMEAVSQNSGGRLERSNLVILHISEISELLESVSENCNIKQKRTVSKSGYL
jgi:hypothetical protein